jgi:NAD(P)-dependent dehydrogenase (short-subunit alcohol dehydrogenase family)
LLTLSLLNLLKKSSNARIINVSSTAHMRGRIHFENINLRNNAYSPSKAYSQSKLANILFTRELTKRLGKNSNIKVYCLHPGIIKTDLMRHIPRNVFINMIVKIFFIDVEMGAQTTLFCALEESLENETGLYYK